MSSKLVVSADIFNLFEIEKFSKLLKKRRDSSSSSENSSKLDQTKNKEDPVEINDKPDTKKVNLILNNKLNGLTSETSDITDKIESGDKNYLNNDNSSMANKLNVKPVNGEPPRETNVCVSSSMSEKSEIIVSSSQAVVREGSSQLQSNNSNNKNKIPVFLIKNSSGKSVPLLIKNSVLLKNSESVTQNVFRTNNRTFINLPNKLITSGNILKSQLNKTEISTPILVLTPNNKPEISENPTENPKEKVKVSTEKSTKISTEISTKISTETSNIQLKPKLKIDSKLVTVKSENHQNCSISSVSTANVSTVQEFVVKTSSGKQIIIPNKVIPLKVVPNVKSTQENKKINTKNILINSQFVPVNFNSKLKVETATNTENNDNVLNLKKSAPKKKIKKSTVDNKRTKTKRKSKTVDTHEEVTKKFRQKLKVKAAKIPENKLYQIKVDDETKNINSKNDVDFLNGCVQMPMYVENWTQTTVEVKKLKDTGSQTDVYVAPTPVSEPIDDLPDIPELINFLLSNPNYSTGMDETTKTDIINNSLKFKPPEPTPIAPASTKPKLSLKERLFFDLRDCIRFDFLGNMPIHNAVWDNSLNDLKRQIYALRLRRFSVDIENNCDQTALQLAVINNKNEDIITTLLANGASVFVKDNIGNTLLHLAVLNTNHHILKLLLGYFNKDTKFLNTKNDEGLTALMVAAIECKPESVAVLLEFGADPNTRDDKSGRTALFHAVELNNIAEVNNIPVINLLLQNKADPKVRNYFGLTALDAIKDQNTTVANMMERQVTRNYPNAEPSGSPKRRTSKRRSAVKNTKMAVVSKKLKVDLSTLEKQQELTGSTSELTKL